MPLLSFLFQLPTASDTLANVGAYSVPVFNEFFPLAEFALGWILPILVVGFLIFLIIRAFTHHN